MQYDRWWWKNHSVDPSYSGARSEGRGEGGGSVEGQSYLYPVTTSASTSSSLRLTSNLAILSLKFANDVN